MQNRLRLLKGATALLYFGPLLAGLGGHGWAVVPVFAVIFLLWLFILRPQQWPRQLADWARPEALISLLTQGVVQVLLVALSFGIGRGIGGVLGFVPPIPLMLPVAISFLSIPLARMLWDPWKADEMAGLLDDALARLEGISEGPAPEDLQARIASAGRMVTELDRLPEGASPELLAEHLRAMATQTSQEALRVALMDPIYDRSASPVQWRAAVVHATEGAVADYLEGTSYAAAVFHELTDLALVQLFATRCLALVGENPARGDDCPSPADVRAMVETMPRAAEALAALAAALESAGARAG